MSGKVSVHHTLAAKGQRKWIQLHVDAEAKAAAVEAAGIRILSCEADAALPAIRAAAPSRGVAIHAMPLLCSADICGIVAGQTTGSIGVGMWLLIFSSSVRICQSNKLLSGQCPKQCPKLEVEQ